MIVRAPRPERYTVVSNKVIEDDRLSFKALGLLTYILSKPDNWTVSREHLAGTHADGLAAVRSALQELRDAGYLTVEYVADGAGRLAGRRIIVHAEPQPGPSPSGTESDRLETDRSEMPPVVSTEVVTTENQPVVTSREQLTLMGDRSPAAQRPTETAALDPDLWFGAFWAAYPRHGSKRAAKQAWAKAIRRAPRERIIAGARAYAADPNLEPQFTKLPATWLNQDCWDDDPLPDRGSSSASAAGRTSTGLRQTAALAAGSFLVDPVPIGPG